PPRQWQARLQIPRHYQYIDGTWTD
ncbi:GST N-terminal domain-containing protein, partial [Psidium guajava]